MMQCFISIFYKYNAYTENNKDDSEAEDQEKDENVEVETIFIEDIERYTYELVQYFNGHFTLSLFLIQSPTGCTDRVFA